MIVPSMTPDEKVRQMEKIKPYILEAGQKWCNRNMKVLLRTKVFPTFYTSDLDLSHISMGKWTLIVIAESKFNIKHGIACIKAYQTYHVPYAKNPSNIGTGIYGFNATDDGVVSCNEFPPHYFNRMRERFVAERKIAQPDFPHLVKMMYGEHFSSMDETITGYKYKKDESGKYVMVVDHDIDRQSGYKNLVTYHKKGISLGVSAADRRYFMFTTYVSNSLLYPNQVEAQKRRMSELLVHQHNLTKNPFAVYDRNEWQLSDGTVIK